MLSSFSARLRVFCSPLLVLYSIASTCQAPGSLTSPEKSDIHSDALAVQAMQNLIAKSGGLSAWQGVRSTKEVFSVSKNDQDGTPALFLDDWSQETTRYRRAIKGSRQTPADHNGQKTMTVKVAQREVVIPEFDQARMLVNRLPAAAAEIMLRRTEYVLKVSTTLPCEVAYFCLDVFRAVESSLPIIPEQRWKILVSTGLPDSILVKTAVVGGAGPTIWSTIRYASFTSQSDLVIPETLSVGTGSHAESWKLISLKLNPEFNTASFDQEAGQ